MALKSERHETVVNPNEGIYVEMEQIMEVGFEFEKKSVLSIVLSDVHCLLTD